MTINTIGNTALYQEQTQIYFTLLQQLVTHITQYTQETMPAYYNPNGLVMSNKVMQDATMQIQHSVSILNVIYKDDSINQIFSNYPLLGYSLGKYKQSVYPANTNVYKWVQWLGLSWYK